jgi:SMODS-associating 2TM, beta-strand rich effector domain
VHEYVSTYVERRKWVASLTLAAVAASFWMGALFHQLDLPTAVAPPTALTLFGAIFALFNLLLWRLAIRGHTLGQIPDLHGTWQGTIDIREGRDGEPSATIPCTVEIKQNWSRISIEFKTENTHSSSVMASLRPWNEGGLHYEYDVGTDRGAKRGESPTADAERHYGTAQLLPSDETWEEMTGKFYNDEAFQRWGKYKLTRVRT